MGAAAGRPAAILEAVWRRERLRLLAALAARLKDLELAEEALSDAAAAAQAHWPAGPVPDDPAAWLYRAALRKALDRLRRRATEARQADALARDVEEAALAAESEPPDARLGLFFACAQPALAPEAQTALMLYHLAGLSTGRIARAFLASEAAVQQRLKRARDKLKATGEPYAPPPPGRWPERLPTVLSAIEILYDQSYADLSGGLEVEALGRDALHLAQALADSAPGEAEVLALAALLELLEARRPARRDAAGRLIPFAMQDPARWDVARIARAAALLHRAAAAVPSSVLPPGPYAIRAQIETARGLARREGASRAHEILALYDQLMACAPSPVVAINRALALADAAGPEAGAAALHALEAAEAQGLDRFAPWRLARAELHWRLGERDAARIHLAAACALVPGAAERAFIAEKLAALDDL